MRDPDALVVQRNDLNLTDGTLDKGYQRCTLTRADGAIGKFVSYCDDDVVWYYGTQPSGFYGAIRPRFGSHLRKPMDIHGTAATRTVPIKSASK